MKIFDDTERIQDDAAETQQNTSENVLFKLFNKDLFKDYE
jgi:hypothetical protein